MHALTIFSTLLAKVVPAGDVAGKLALLLPLLHVPPLHVTAVGHRQVTLPTFLKGNHLGHAAAIFILVVGNGHLGVDVKRVEVENLKAMSTARTCPDLGVVQAGPCRYHLAHREVDASLGVRVVGEEDNTLLEGGREGRREGRREGWREGGKEGGMEGGREGGRDGGREEILYLQSEQ